jgi:hypothetical protein
VSTGRGATPSTPDELGASRPLAQAAGIAGLVVVALAGYCALAFDLGGLRRRPVLPTFRRGPARAVVSGDMRAALEGVGREPGGREVT